MVKKLVWIISGVLGLFIVMGSVMFVVLSNNMKQVRAIEIEEMNTSELEDQVLEGSYYYENQIGATVLVTITNGEITKIEFTDHIYGLGGKAEQITSDIIEQQSLLVDDISGATTSSHIIKLAIMDALEVE